MTVAERKFRADVIMRDRSCCFCGCKGQEVHHVVRRSQSKELQTEPRNGMYLCRNCHTGLERYPNRDWYWLEANRPDDFHFLLSKHPAKLFKLVSKGDRGIADMEVITGASPPD